MTKDKLLIWFCLILLGVFFIAIRWGSFNAPFERDEGEYAYTAWIMSEGASPYKNVYNQKPPLIYYTYYLINSLGIDSLWPYRAASSLSIFLTALLIGFICLKEFGKREAFLSMWIFILIINFPFLTSFAANTEVFMILPLTALLALYIAARDKANPFHFFVGGILASLAVFYKPICILTAIFILLVWIKEAFERGEENSNVLKKTAFTFLGGALGSILILLPIVKLGALGSFWELVVKYNSLYYRASGSSVYFLVAFGEFLLNMPVVVVLTFYFLLKRPSRWKFWVGILLLSLLVVYRTNFAHYYILIIPFLAVISARSLSILANKFHSSLNVGNKGKALPAVFMGFFFLTLLWPIKDLFSLNPTGFVYRVYGTDEPFYESIVASSRLEEITQPSDPVFIAGSEPQILFYAKRKNVSKFVYTYPLIIDTPVRQDLQSQLVSELEQNPPVAIVYSSTLPSWYKNGYVPSELLRYLNKLVNEKYTLVGGFIKDMDKGYWQEPLGVDDFERASLVLFKKIN